ncbi:hypothetical protein [Klebsiella pneumoniae IS33]|nr:hypothetical protein [Klebsiella pneumoniae IS33]
MIGSIRIHILVFQIKNTGIAAGIFLNVRLISFSAPAG